MTFAKKLAPCALLVLLSAPARPASAATPCETAVEVAGSSYDLGRFEAIPGELAPCLQGTSGRQETAQAYSLLARAYIALDRETDARTAVRQLLKADPLADPTEPPLFVQMVQAERGAAASRQVSSVSKTGEDLRDTPATVEVIRAEEIERRGYLDLEEMLHDLPGFDVSRANGDIYSSYYQRGFRANNTDRNLLLLDGLEQNELRTNAVYLSRQYALSNVDRVEVVQGPASTMYGANAYTGVINIITKDPESLIPAGRQLGYSAQAGGGALGTRYADATVAGREGRGTIAWSLTGRIYRSTEMDLSRFPDWDYDLSKVNYEQRLTITTPRDASNFYVACRHCDPSLFIVDRNDRGQVVSVRPTPKAAQLARDLDQQFLAQSRSHFSDLTDDWSLAGRLRISNLTLGFQLWQLREGIAPWYTETYLGGRGDANLWAPRQASFFFRFSHPLTSDLTFNVLGRYYDSGLDRDNSRQTRLFLYSNLLGLFDLVQACGGDPGTVCTRQPYADVIKSGELSNQFRTDVDFVYQSLGRLRAVGGIDLRRSSIQPTVDLSHSSFGTSSGDEHAEHTDVGLYLQASYALSERFQLVAGGRLDNSTIKSTINSTVGQLKGFGTLFTSRAALIFKPRPDLALKAIYSDAFKDPSDAEKRGVLISDPAVHESLDPEKVTNYELTATWETNARLSFSASAYQARYHDVVLFACPANGFCLVGGNINGGEYRITGFQAEARYWAGSLDLYGNYAFTDPLRLGTRTTDGDLIQEQLPIGDIARHHVNAGVSAPLGKKLDLSLRANWVDSRRTGLGTTVSTNPLHETPSYFIANAALSYTVLPGVTAQLIVKNLLDKEYFDPGVQAADGVILTSRVPQPGRTVYLRLLTGLDRRRESP
jgi:outer membrane receptor protein involved in Fe transport